MQAGGLSLVIGRNRSPNALIQGVGGQIVLILSPTKVLAYLPLAQIQAFQHHPHIAFAGPVELDRARFAQFIALLQQSRRAGEQPSNHMTATTADADT